MFEPDVGVVYGLHDPQSEGLFYVGRTVGRLERRIAGHVADARGLGRCCSAPRYLRATGCQPEAIVLERTFESDLGDVEARWIATCRAAGHPLVNVSPGGSEDLATFRKVLREAMNRPEVKARHRAAKRASHAKPEVRERLSVATKIAMARPDVKARHRAAIRAALADPAIRARRRETLARPEVKAKQRAAMKAASARPEVRMHRSAGQLRRWAGGRA